jgi:ABC-2 type transport system permease protein
VTALTLFRSSLRDSLRPKRLAGAAVMALLPAGAALLWKLTARRGFEPDVAYSLIATTMVFGLALVILTVVFCTNVVSQEVEQKTIVYLLTRPVRRWVLLLARYVAALAFVVSALWASDLLLAAVVYGPAHLKGTPVGRDLLILPLGAVAYGALFLLLATLFNKPLVYGLLFAFGYETWVPNLPGSFSKWSLMAYLRVLAPHTETPKAGFNIGELLQFLAPDKITSGLAWKVILLVPVVCLITACAVFSRGQYVPREDTD